MITENKVFRFFEKALFDSLAPFIFIVAGFFAAIKHLPSLSETTQGNGAFLSLTIVIVSIVFLVALKLLKDLILKIFKTLQIQTLNMMFIFFEFFAVIFFKNAISWVFDDGFINLTLIIIPIPFLIELVILMKKRAYKQIYCVLFFISIIMTFNIVLTFIISLQIAAYFNQLQLAIQNIYMIIKNIQFLPLLLVMLFMKKKNGTAAILSAFFAILVSGLELFIFAFYDFTDILKGKYETLGMLVTYFEQLFYLSVIVCMVLLIVSALYPKNAETLKQFYALPAILGLIFNIAVIIFYQSSFDPFILLIVVAFAGLRVSPVAKHIEAENNVSTNQYTYSE